MPNSTLLPCPWNSTRSVSKLRKQPDEERPGKQSRPDKLDYRPHERSPSTGQIAWTILRGLFIRIDCSPRRSASSDVMLEAHPSFQEIFDRFEDASHRHAQHNWPRGRKPPGRKPASYAPAAMLHSTGKRQVTSSGSSTSMRSIIAASFPPLSTPHGRQGPIDL